MVIGGAGGHAREVLDILVQSKYKDQIVLFDPLNPNTFEVFGFKGINTIPAIQQTLIHKPQFLLGTGNPYLRKKFSTDLKSCGGKLTTIIAPSSIISTLQCTIADGTNIMSLCLINNNVSIGEGCLINARVTIHHDVKIGAYCEISPSVTLLGNVSIGDFTMIGSGAVILPKIKIGSNCVIGAGAVVRHDIPDHSVAVGVPAIIIKQNNVK